MSGITYPTTYNSYTGMLAMSMNAKFLNDSEDLVLYGLGITSNMVGLLLCMLSLWLRNDMPTVT